MSKSIYSALSLLRPHDLSCCAPRALFFVPPNNAPTNRLVCGQPSRTGTKCQDLSFAKHEGYPGTKPGHFRDALAEVAREARVKALTRL